MQAIKLGREGEGKYAINMCFIWPRVLYGQCFSAHLEQIKICLLLVTRIYLRFLQIRPTLVKFRLHNWNFTIFTESNWLHVQVNVWSD